MAAAVAATVRRGAPDCTSARIATSNKDAAADKALGDAIPSRRGSEATRNSLEPKWLEPKLISAKLS